jgi:hypothetical protein
MLAAALNVRVLGVIDLPTLQKKLNLPLSEPEPFAGWIAPPKVGIDNKPGDFEYVKVAA